MKRINRKKLIEELESLRMGFRTAHDFIARTKCEKISMRANHFFANRLVEKYGGEPVEDIPKESPRREVRSGSKQQATAKGTPRRKAAAASV